MNEISSERVPTPEAETRRAELADCLRRQQGRFLDEALLHATVMRWVAEDGLSNADVARLLDRTPGATREFISQARKKARHFYAECYKLAFGDGPSATERHTP